MGTRFMCTVEAPIHINVKQAIVDAEESDTELVLRKWRNTSRLFKNKVAREAVALEKSDTTGDFGKSGIGQYVSGQRGRQVFLNGDVDYGVWTAGQVIGLIHDIPTCEVLVKRIETEAFDALQQAASLWEPETATGAKIWGSGKSKL